MARPTDAEQAAQYARPAVGPPTVQSHQENTMYAPYTPPAGQARCPYCDHPVAVVLEAPAVTLAALQITCPACGREWNELRGRGPIQRYWESTGAAEGATHGR
jgi:hypothetical protein